MNTNPERSPLQEFVPFDRDYNDPDDCIRVIGTGEIGGKASGLVFINELLSSDPLHDSTEIVTVGIPVMTVLRSDVFDAFMEKNDLYGFRDSDFTDDQIAQAFLQAELPFYILGDFHSLVEKARTPLAVRSSSLLEDAAFEPFAGIYATKIIPNHQFDPDSFDLAQTRQIAAELEGSNAKLVAENRPYLLIVFGRLGVYYLAVPRSGEYQLDWDWLNNLPEIRRTEYIRHVQTIQPLSVKIDGRSGRGIIQKTEV